MVHLTFPKNYKIPNILGKFNLPTMYVFDNGDYYDYISLKLVSKERLQKIMNATKSNNAHIFRKYGYTWIRVNSTYIYHIENKSDCNISKSHAWFLEKKGVKVDYGKRVGWQKPKLFQARFKQG